MSINEYFSTNPFSIFKLKKMAEYDLFGDQLFKKTKI